MLLEIVFRECVLEQSIPPILRNSSETHFDVGCEGDTYDLCKELSCRSLVTCNLIRENDCTVYKPFSCPCPQNREE